jgi:hypothetical protein
MSTIRIFNLKCSKSQALNDYLQANSNSTHWAHPLFRTSSPNFMSLVSPGVGVVRHLRCFPKWYIRKYSVWHFLRNRPLVVIFDDFHNKLPIFSSFYHTFRTILPIMANNRVNNNFMPVASFTMGQKFEIVTLKLFLVAYFDINRLDFALFYEIRL